MPHAPSHPRARYGTGGGTTPAWTFAQEPNGMWLLRLEGGRRMAEITLYPDEFAALLQAADAKLGRKKGAP